MNFKIALVQTLMNNRKRLVVSRLHKFGSEEYPQEFSFSIMGDPCTAYFSAVP